MKPTVLFAAFLFLLCYPFWATGFAEEDDETPRNGLSAEYADGSGSSFRRIDEQVSLVMHAAAPDRRLAAEAFDIRWHGYVLIQKAGEYRFPIWLDGQCNLRIANELLTDRIADEPRLIDSRAISLEPGWQPISLRFDKTNETAAIRLFWAGPGFEVEPIGPRNLFHDPSDEVDTQFERGADLVRAFRCAACHQISGEPSPLAAPALDRVTETNIDTAWLVDWLAADLWSTSKTPAAERNRNDRNCPSFNLTRNKASAVVAFLRAESSDQVPAETRTPVGDAAAGERLFVSTGCLACHRVGELGSHGQLGGGDLSNVGRKRPKAFFARWLNDPSSINRDHRMPIFEFNDQQRTDLTEYLTTLNTEDDVSDQVNLVTHDERLLATGRQVINTHGCAACHRLPNATATAQNKSVALSASSDWESGCTVNENRKSPQPSFDLGKHDAAAIEHFIAEIHSANAATTTSSERTAADLIRENHCLACHARGISAGIATTARDVTKRHSTLASEFAALIPPPLNQIGDKLTDDGLRAAIGRTSVPLRPWLRVQMPRFRFEKVDVDLLVDYFAEHDRLPVVKNQKPTLPDAVLTHAGARLVTGDGFGCTSCHAVGKYKPAEAPLNSLGPNLSHVSGRIRPAWFQRWVRNPLRVVSNVEMPAIATAVPGVLDDDLDNQIAAVWRTVNEPEFSLPAIEPVRTLRKTGERDENAAVLTDVLRFNTRTFLKPFVIGLSNRHNIMLDLDQARLQAWWIGDVASQINEGKVWYWQAEVRDLLANLATNPDIFLLKDDGSVHAPMRIGQFVTEPDAWRHVDGGVELSYRLHFDVANTSEPQAIRVRETVTCLTDQNGFRRSLRFFGVPASMRIRVRLRDAVQNETHRVSLQEHSIQVANEDGASITIRVSGGNGFRVAQTGFVDQVGVSIPAPSLILDYTTNLAPDRYLVPNVEIEPATAMPLHVVPGFTATRLPVTHEIMPTGLAWRNDGTLFVTSLKGRVWRLTDMDGDGLHDSAQVFSDELATPYGVVAGEDFVDVINKFALSRIFDSQDGGRANRTITLASGWGHTDDYHDWVVGLNLDEHSNYYVAIPCQQDDRSAAAAYLRGKVLRLVPHSPTDDDPRRFAIEEVSGGHRFPMGIARNRNGALFVTDNQGNYNPFNELNHVIDGRRYGFINKLEQKPGFSPPLTPPAIDIPHPWTRSVNGICFLETPQSVREDARGESFGPFEGHIIGCEYDTRRLIRMSLEKVGDTYQGATYPFSYDTPPLGPPLLGPAVCAVAPDGALYVGNLRDSGWGAGQNTGSIVRMVPDEAFPPAGIAEVRAERDGFVIELTRPVVKTLAEDPNNFSVASYRRISTPQYGGDDVDRRAEEVTGVSVSADRRTVRLKLKQLRRGFVYEFHLATLNSDDDFFPAEAYYTLNEIP